MVELDIKHQRIFRFSESNAQGVAYAHDGIWFLASEKKISMYAIEGPLAEPRGTPQRLREAHLSEIAGPATRMSTQHTKSDPARKANGEPRNLKPGTRKHSRKGAFDHIGDITYSNGLLFVPVRDKNRSLARDALLVLSEQLELVGYSYLDKTSEGWCSINPSNGRLYMSDKHKPHHLLAYDVDAFYQLLDSQKHSQWPQFIPIKPCEEHNIYLTKSDGSPDEIHSIQGAHFTSEDRLWIARYWTSTYLFRLTEWHNYVRLYNAKSGRIIGSTGEIDFDGIGDEIEGVSMDPQGTLCVVVAVNGSSGDKFDVYAFDVPNVNFLVPGGGGVASDQPRKLK